MAGEAVSRTSLTLAFQRKQDLEWRKLREHLHLQLQQDIGRIYTKSLYCDLELVFSSTSIQTHCSILQVRAARFFTKLCSFLPASLHTVLLDSASVDYIESFIRSLYTKCTVIDEEAAVQYLEELHNLAKSSGDSGLSPESDVYLTPNSSPSEIYNHFDVTKTHSSDNTKSASAETLINLQKTNHSYYTIVPVDEAFIEENNCSKSFEVCNILEKELAEQDELLKSFHSIKSKEDKQSTVHKINKPTSLPFTSSQYTKKYKRGCDITYTRHKKEGKDLLESKLQPSSCNKEDLVSLNAIQFVHREQNNGNLLRINSLKKDKCLVDKFESRKNTIQEEEERESSKNTSGVSENVDNCVELQNSANNNEILEEEEFMESPGEGVGCELECCKRNLTAEDLLNFPCSEEMDAGGGGPDSGLDTSSTGCMPGGGFSSPRDHTVSETSGIDLTEAAIGEDMPHDGDVDIVLRKPVKSSTSSSVSSDAGTWDSTFPAAHFLDTQVTQLDCVTRCLVPSGGICETLMEPCDKEKLLVNTKSNQYEAIFMDSDEPPTDGVSKLETEGQLNVHHNVQDLEVKLPEESTHGAHTYADNICTSPENIPPQNICNVPSLVQWSCQSEGSIQDPSPTGPEYNVQEVSLQTNSSSNKLTESLTICSEDAHGWRLSNQNNYFINAADLADDDMLLLPPPVASEQQDKTAVDTDTSELEIVQKSFSASSPCGENISTCDIVNKGITDVLNMKAKYTAVDTLPVEAHAEAFCEDVVPFLSSHINIKNEKLIVNDFQHVTENNLKTANKEPTSDPLMKKLTAVRVVTSKDELQVSNAQDVFAEFQKEIKVTEHLEPHVNIRKLHGGWKLTDSCSSEDLSKQESLSFPAYIFSDCNKPQIKDDEIVIAHVSAEEKDNNASSKEVSVDEVASTAFCSKQNEETETHLDEKKEEETEVRRPSLIRRNTFELDPDDDRLALLRQEYERRQGNLLFQSCIPQFSGHLTGSEGFQDAQGLLTVTSKDEDLDNVETQRTSLSTVTHDTSLTETSSYVSDRSEEQVLSSETLITDSSPLVLSSCVFSNHDIHMLDSVSNDRPLDSLFHSQMSHISLSQEGSECQQFCETVDNDSKYPEEKKSLDIGNSKNKSYIQSNLKIYESKKEDDVGRTQKGDLKRMSSSFDNSTKPVISGALTCSDVVIDEKRLCDTPKKQKRTESTPIVSGGVSSIDFVVPARPVVESPVMARRKTESAPILSGGATLIEPEQQKAEVKSSANMASVNSAWVVDMSDCSSNAAKPPIEPRRQKKTNVAGNNGQLSENSISQHKQSEMKTNALGFFVDLKDTPADSQINKKPRKEIINDRDFKSRRSSSPGRRNSGVGFFVDLNEHNDPTNKRLMPSEGKEICHINTDEPKSVIKNASYGFFVNLDKKSVNEHITVSEKLAGTGDDKNDSKNTLFSLFIDISETGIKQESSIDSSQGSVSSPHLSSHKKLGFRSQTEIVSSTESNQTCEHTLMNIDANIEAQSQVKSPLQDETENKKQGFFMFIEAESPVTRRKTLSTNLRSNLNRHSLNLEPSIGEQDDQQKGNGRRHHKRAHSLSVERGNVCSPDKSRSLSSTSLAKSKVKSSSQSLHEADTSPDQGNGTQCGDEMFLSSHYRQPLKSNDQLAKHAVSYAGKSERSKETPATDMLSERKLLSEGASHLPVICKELEGAGDNFTTPQSCDMKNRHSDVVVVEADDPSQKNVVTQKERENMCRNPLEATDLQQGKHTEDVLAIAEGCSLDENVSVRASAESEALSKDSCVETNFKSLETSFVKLSDLDKEPSKIMSTVTDSNDILPSFATANRMTRSIPETSWIESKLLMTRSTGGGTSSRSLSRLFPHLHTTVTATSSPSNIGRSKSPSVQPDADDNDTQISETSDLSSMQSSMGPSGLEGSTEETDASSSYAGRSGPVSRLGEDLLRMFLEEINPDVTVEVGGRRLKAHKCILSSRCQYFAAILSGGWVESAGNVISLQGFSYNAVHFALCHIYSGTSNIPDTISIVELATLADMLGLEGLKEVIMYTLKVKYCHFFHKPCTMCAAGVLECLPLAAAYGLDDIYRKSLRWITKYFVRIWPTKGFASLPRELIDKCYQQHVVHMTVDSVLETVMCCDKLLATLPNVRWAEPVFGITSQLLEASIKFIANNFCGVLSNDSFLSLGKELSWNISRLEDSLMAATDRLPPDQACQSYARLHNILTIARSSEPPPEMQWSPSFIELLNRIQKRVEVSLVRQAPRAARCPSWGHMELELRKKIQDAACLVLVPTEEGHRSRHASLAKRGESVGSGSVLYTAPRSVSSSGSHCLDLRQVKLAMTQQARRAASGGRVSTLKADTKPRLQSAKKSQSSTHVPQHKADTVSSQAKKVVSENGESTSRPKTWPLRVLENKSKSAKQRANSSSSSMGTPEKSGAVPRRAGKAMISSSDSSRTSSPAMKRSTSSGEGSGRGRAATVGNASSRNLVRRSETPPGKEMRSKKRKDNEVIAMSTDSLSEVQSIGGDQHLVKDAGDSITTESCICTHPDTPSVRQKLGEEVIMSTDSLAESVASGEKLSLKTKTIASVTSHSLGSTRPDTPPIKDRGRRCLGRIGVEATVSTDVLAATEPCFSGESSTVRKMEVAKTMPIPKSPTSKGSHSNTTRFDGSKVNLVKGAKNGETRNEITQPRSPAATARRVIMRQTIVSPRDSPTFRLQSGVTSSPYTGSPSLRRSLLLATRSPTNDSAACVNNMTSTTAKPEKVVKSVSIQSSTISANKRTPARLQTRNHPVASPVKSSSESGRGVTRSSGREAVRGNTGGKGVTDVSKANNNATRKVISNGSVHGKNKQNNNEVSTPNKKVESSEEKPLSVGSRSGTFLKDEPTILKKPNVDNVQK